MVSLPSLFPASEVTTVKEIDSAWLSSFWYDHNQIGILKQYNMLSPSDFLPDIQLFHRETSNEVLNNSKKYGQVILELYRSDQKNCYALCHQFYYKKENSLCHLLNSSIFKHKHQTFLNPNAKHENRKKREAKRKDVTTVLLPGSQAKCGSCLQTCEFTIWILSFDIFLHHAKINMLRYESVPRTAMCFLH